MKYFFEFFLLSIFIMPFSVMGQAVTIDNANFEKGTYGINSDIFIPVKIAGCFNFGNRFEMYLSDQNGTFNTAKKIGEFIGFFTPFVNGLIPTGIVAGNNYKIRIISTNPKDTVESQPFSISVNAGSRNNTNSFDLPDRIVAATGDTVFGKCLYSKFPYEISITSGSPGNLQFKLLDSLNIQKSVASSNTSSPKFSVDKGNYYTLISIVSNNSVISSKGYLVLASTTNLSLQTGGSNEICFPDTKIYSTNLSGNDGIQYNYPGTRYRISWGDATSADSLTHCQLVSNGGQFRHFYNKSSCGQPQIDLGNSIQYNAFKVNVTALNDYCQNSFTPITTYAKVFERPVAIFSNPAVACVNSRVTFSNLSKTGISAPNNKALCDSSEALYKWFINDNRQSSSGRDFQYTFSSPGKYKIKLVVENDPCQHETEKTICIEPVPIPKFLVNNQDSVAECASGSLKITTTNNSNANPCRNHEWKWLVYNDSTGILLVPPADYTITPNDTAKAPVFNFTKPGRYRIVLQVTNSCGTFEDAHIVKVLSAGASGSVKLPVNNGYCVSNKTIDFGIDLAHKPTYSSNEVGETYNWTVTGASTYSFQSPSTAGSRYPIIVLNGYGIYTVSVSFTNKCGTQSASQQIVLNAPVVVDAGPSDLQVCYSQDTIMLAGTVAPSTGVKWTSNGTGTFTPDNNLKTFYTISAADKLKADIVLKLDAGGGGACLSSFDSIKLKIFPDNKGNNSTDTICSGTKLNKVPASTVAGSSFSWTSIVTKGVITGNTTAGSGAIADVLANTSASNDGEVTYTITPKANNCTGVPFSYKVTVQPIPDLSVSASQPVICSGATTNIQLSSSLSGANYSWTSVVNAGTATGNSSASKKAGPITDRLVNTGTTDAKVTYTVNAIGISPGNCSSQSQPIEITISAGVPAVDAGPNQVLCNAIQAQLAGSNPLPGSGTWTQSSGPTVTIVSPSLPGTPINGLTANGIYKFLWTVKSGNNNCGSAYDSVIVAVRPVTTKADAGADSSFCSVGNSTYTLQGNAPQAYERGRWTIVSSTFSPAPVFSDDTNPVSILKNLKTGVVELKWEITSDAVGCNPTSDNVILKIGAATEAAVAGADEILCNVFEVTLKATTVSSPSSGKWSVLSSPAARFDDSSGAKAKVTGLVIGDNKFIWTVTNDLCPNANRDTVNIIVRTAISKAFAGKDTVFCGSTGTSSYKLEGNNPGAFEKGIWKVQSNTMASTPSFVDASFSNTLVNNLSPGILTLVWEISNDGNCPPNRDTVIIRISGASANAIAGQGQQLCNQTFTKLNATPVTNPSVGIWSFAGSSPANITDASKPSTDITGLPMGKTILVWTVNNNICVPKTDTTIIEVFASLANSISGIQTICSGQSASITGQVPTGGNGVYNYQWQQSTNNVNFSDIPNETGKDITVSPLQNTWYRRYVKSVPCEMASDTVLITVLPGISNNTISPSQNICIKTPAAIISGSTPTGGGGTYKYGWEKSLDAGNTWQIILGENGIDYNPGILDTTTWYRRIVSTQLCVGPQGAASNTVIITVNPDAKAFFEPLTTRNCAPFDINATIINQSVYPDRNGNFNWYVNESLLSSGIFPGYQIKNAGDSVLIKLVAISKFGCKNDSTQAWFYSPVNPKPAFTLSDTVGCGPISVAITNTTSGAADFNFTWDFGDGQTSTSTQPDIIVFQPNPNYGDTVYTVTLKATGGCDTILATQKIRVKSKPKSLFTPNKVLGCSPMTVKFFNNSRGSNASFAWDFGDGTPVIPADSNSISHTFFTAKLDTFHVRLYGSNDCGIDTQQYAIVVNPNSIKLNFAVNGNQVNGCAPHAVLFVNNTVGANQFVWKFGDGSPDLTSTKGVDSVWHTYTKTGNYTVQLFATNSCSDTSTSLNIVVAEKPLVSFTASQQTICVGTQLQLNNTSDVGLAWNWRFGDGTSSSAINPTKAYTVPGTYKIWLIGTKSFSQGFGCSDSSFVDLIVRDTLPGNFTIDKSSGCAPLTVTFKNQNRPSINTIWNFDDGSKASGDSVVHVFNTPGTYQVAMLAQAPTGCKYKLEQAVVVTGNSGELRYNSGYVCPGNPVQFEVISNNTSTYKFYFGNGDSLVSNNSKINYTYKQPGVYVPSVMLITNGCTRILKGIDTIHTDLVNAGFKFTEIQSCGSTQLKFTDTSDAYFGIAQWNWTFGDGTGSTLKNPSKIYNNAGVYNVQLTITGNRGCIDKVTIPITVDIKTKPVSTIVGDSVACTGIKLALLAAVQSNEPLQASSWNFGNGIFATGSNASVLYNAAGTYNVTLISRTSFGCADTVSKQIKVNPSPVVNAGPDKRICLGQSTQLNVFGAVQYTWSPTQGLSCFNCSNPVASPAITTNYAVTGTNSFGCPNTDSIIVEVVQPFKISVTANDTLCIGQSSQLFASGANSYRWNPAVGLNNTTIPNPIAKPASTTLYRVVGFDAYNCFTDTAYTTVAVGQYPVVKLGGGNLVVAGTAIQFNPLISNGPFKNYTWTPATDLSCNNCPKPVATINNNITYTLKAENIYGCSGTDTISYQVMCSKDDQVYIPNAFSPDGDGINDVFMVYGKGIKVDYFRVYNRWGQVVFDGGSNYLPNLPQYGWDGKVNGKPATQDVYVYTVQLKCTAGGTFTYKGNVSLLLMR